MSAPIIYSIAEVKNGTGFEPGTRFIAIRPGGSEPQQVVIERVIDLWNNQKGGIPGAAYKKLAEALGVSTDRLVHYDKGRHHYPPGVPMTVDAEKVRVRDIVVVDGLRVAWINHTEEFHVTYGYDDGTVRRQSKWGNNLVTVKRGV